MKGLVVFLFALCTGCNANLLYVDEPKPQLEVLTDAIWVTAVKAKQTVDETLQMARESPLVQDLSDRLYKGARAADRCFIEIQMKLPPAAKEMIRGVVMGTWSLKWGLDKRAEEAAPQMERIQSELIQRARHMRDMASPYTEKLLGRLNPLALGALDRLTIFFESFGKTN